MEGVKILHEKYLKEGFGDVYLPNALGKNILIQEKNGMAIRFSLT